MDQKQRPKAGSLWEGTVPVLTHSHLNWHLQSEGRQQAQRHNPADPGLGWPVRPSFRYCGRVPQTLPLPSFRSRGFSTCGWAWMSHSTPCHSFWPGCPACPVLPDASELHQPLFSPWDRNCAKMSRGRDSGKLFLGSIWLLGRAQWAMGSPGWIQAFSVARSIRAHHCPWPAMLCAEDQELWAPSARGSELKAEADFAFCISFPFSFGPE